MAFGRILVVAVDHHNLAGVRHQAIEHNQLVEDMAGWAAELADHMERKHHQFAVAVVAACRVYGMSPDDHIGHQLVEVRMARLAYHQEQHQLGHHFE